MPWPEPRYNIYWIVVHGSFAPGGADHHRLDGLSGEWHRGTFNGTAGVSFADMIVERYKDNPTEGWALQLASEPDLPWAASEADGNSKVQMFERWEQADALFGEDVVRVETNFTFEASGAEENVVCQANTYATPSMFPNARYDSPHPGVHVVDLWLEVAAGTKDYDPCTFMGMINDLDPNRYRDAFSGLPNSEGFISRLERLASDQTPPAPADRWSLYFVPQLHNAVADSELTTLAEQALRAKSRVITASFDGNDVWAACRSKVESLSYKVAEPNTDMDERGDLDVALYEFFGDSCDFAEPDPWAFSLGEACYSIAANYDLSYWLTQDWARHGADLTPIYEFWKAGGRTTIDNEGVCHVSAVRAKA